PDARPAVGRGLLRAAQRPARGGGSGQGAVRRGDDEKALHAARLGGLKIQVAIFEPGGQKMHLSVNRSPASAGPYTVFDLAELFARKPLEPEEEEPAGK
ncbi:MAG: hypothetical protein R6V58_09155, partial [Planctomycetota bacterium]